MPISDTKSARAQDWSWIYNSMIKPAVTGSRLGFSCERAKPRTGSFIRDILNQLNTSDVVIAELTDQNANVFYELGVRHTLRRRTILIAQHMKYVPSDLQSYWVVLYKYKKTRDSIYDFRRKIREVLRGIISNPDKPDSPVADFLTDRNVALLSIEKSASIKKLTALVSELSYNISSVDKILELAKQNREKREKKEAASVSVLRFNDSCLNLLLSTYYIAPSEDVQNLLRDVAHEYTKENCRLELWSQPAFAKGVESSAVSTLPQLKIKLIELLKMIGKVRADYISDNYPEQPLPAPILSDESHEKYILAT